VSRSDIESYVVESVCNTYFGGRKDDGCDDCRRKPECDQILTETFTFIEQLNRKKKSVA